MQDSGGRADNSGLARSAPAMLAHKWKRIARYIARLQARLILFLFYFLVLAPFALLVRWFSDPLGLKPGAPKGWQPLPERDAASLERARKQY